VQSSSRLNTAARAAIDIPLQQWSREEEEYCSEPIAFSQGALWMCVLGSLVLQVSSLQ